jgi:membrane protein DedA with SNARE-associated domain
MSLLQAVYDNAHFILLFASALNSATIAIMGGVAAHAAHLFLIDEVIILSLGSKVFMQIYFHLGRKGRRYVKNRVAKDSKVEKVLELDNKGLYAYILAYRFLPGLRTVSPFAIGATKVKLFVFIILDSIGAILWGVVFSLVGYLFGAVAMHLFSDAEHYENIAFVIIIVAAVLISATYIVKYFAHKKTVLF